MVRQDDMAEKTIETPIADDVDQIVERLQWTPRERLRYLLEMLAFEERAHAATPLPRRS